MGSLEFSVVGTWGHYLSVVMKSVFPEQFDIVDEFCRSTWLYVEMRHIAAFVFRPSNRAGQSAAQNHSHMSLGSPAPATQHTSLTHCSLARISLAQLTVQPGILTEMNYIVFLTTDNFTFHILLQFQTKNCKEYPQKMKKSNKGSEPKIDWENADANRQECLLMVTQWNKNL